MTQIGVRCPRGLIKHEECRRCSTDPNRPCHLSPDILEGMREDPNGRHADPDAFSPTGLLDCDRKHALTSDGDWYADVDSAWPMLRGTLVHALMENYRYPGAVGVLREVEMEVKIDTRYGPQRMTGQPDLIVVNRIVETPDGNRAYVKIVDYKSTNEIKHELTEARQEHQRQINMYAWLVRRWLPTHYSQPLEVEVEEIEIVYLDFKKTRRFTSAGPLTARGKRLNRSAPYTYETLELAPLTLHPDDLVERNIRRMIESKLDAREELPPAYEMGDADYWRCMNCPVVERCRMLQEQGI